MSIAANNTVEQDYRKLCGHFQLVQDLGMDTLDKVELMMHLEEDFDIEFHGDPETKWHIVDDVIDSVRLAGGK